MDTGKVTAEIAKAHAESEFRSRAAKTQILYDGCNKFTRRNGNVYKTGKRTVRENV